MSVNVDAEKNIIENLAFKLKFGNLSKVKRQVTEFRLLSELMKCIKLNKYLPQNFNEGFSMLAENEAKMEYDGEILNKAYRSAFEAYGKKDVETGEIIPFLKIFYSHYNVKKQGLAAKFLNDRKPENKLKMQRINDLLKEISVKYGIDYTKNSFNVLNRGVLEKTFAQWQVGKEEADKVFEILDSSYFCYDDASEKEDTGKIYKVSDSAAYSSGMISDNAQHIISDVLERGYKLCKTNAQKKWFKCIAASKIASVYGIDIPFFIRKYIDEDFSAYYLDKTKKSLKDIELLAGYMNVETETARKKVISFEKLMFGARVR